MTDEAGVSDRSDENAFTSVPIEVVVTVGRAKPMIRDLIGLGKNSILELDRKVDDPVELFVGDRLIAKGNLEEDESGATGKLLVRLTEVVDAKNGI